MSRLVPGLLLAAFLVQALPAQAAAVVARLKAQVSVGHARIELGDIAELSGDAAARAAVEHAAVARAPRVGQVQRLTPAMLGTALRRAGIPVDVAWSGAADVQVTSMAREIPGRDVEAAALSYLQALVRQDGCTFAIARPVDAVEAPLGQVALQVRAIDSAALAPRTQAWVDVLVDGVVYRSVQVPVEVVRERLVLVARSDLRAGAAVGPGQFRAERRNVAGEQQDMPDTLPADGHGRLSRAMRAGEVLTADKMLVADGVMPGDAVHVVARANGVAIEMDGVVVRGGASGQVVEVRVAHSAQPISGNLADGRTVFVQ